MISLTPEGLELLEGWSVGRARCGGTSTLQALGLSVSLPGWQHAWCLACVELCPLGREGSMRGGQIVPTHAMVKQLPLSQDVLWTQQSPVVCSICLSGLLRRLRLAMIDRHVSLLHAKEKKIKDNGCGYVTVSDEVSVACASPDWLPAWKSQNVKHSGSGPWWCGRRF